ncbi:hypothetical protein G6F57_020039 [Rhizopus arrhizus]|nr:hypothetical protein G6F57_020039 [Rhizopus arrhizus]
MPISGLLAAGYGAYCKTPFDKPCQGFPMSLARGYAAHSHTDPLIPYEFERRAVGPDDVRIEILYSGICHSDLHQARGDWGNSGYPMVPGHEIVGRVAQVGKNVTKFKAGDYAGVGCMYLTRWT